MSLTRQEVLTRIYRHFIEDAAPRCAFDGKCRYSPTDEPGSVGCAIGCLLPPEVATFIDTHLNDPTVGHLLSYASPIPRDFKDQTATPALLATAREMRRRIDDILNPADISFYTDLQYWHDRNIKRCASVSDRLAYLAHIAITYDLTLPTEGDPA